jgi:hypothetical protein
MSKIVLKVSLALAKVTMLAYLINFHVRNRLVHTPPEKKGPCFLPLD